MDVLHPQVGVWKFLEGKPEVVEPNVLADVAVYNISRRNKIRVLQRQSLGHTCFLGVYKLEDKQSSLFGPSIAYLEMPLSLSYSTQLDEVEPLSTLDYTIGFRARIHWRRFRRMRDCFHFRGRGTRQPRLHNQSFRLGQWGKIRYP